MLLVLRRLDDQLVGDVRPQLRLAGGEHLVQPAVGARLGRVAIGELLRQRDLRRVDVLDGHALRPRAGGRRRGRRRTSRPRRGRRAWRSWPASPRSRASRRAARLASARKRCASSTCLSSVMSSITLIASRTVPSASRTGLALMRDQRVSRPSRLAELHEHRLGLLAHQRLPAGQRRRRERLAVRRRAAPSGAMISVSGAREQRLGGGEAEHPHGRVVGVDQRAVGPLGGDRVGDALEDRAQVVGDEPLAELGGAQLGDVLAGDERDAVDSSRALTRSVRTPRGVSHATVVPRRRSPRAARTAGRCSSASGRPSASRQRSAGSQAAAEPPDGVVAAQLARGAVGGEHAAGAGLDGHDRGRESVEHRIRPADLGSARRGR